ncbi:MAG: PTS sugar transporter subunit IIA [Gemmataceae bacterium]|nr:PTS sugar transporter subunit IIA [Gemmataceae bacterium]
MDMHDSMDIDQLANYLQRDARELGKMADRGRLPGQKVAGQWRFAPAEINHWVETQLKDYSDKELAALEVGARRGKSCSGLLVTKLLTPATMAVPIAASTKPSVLKQLVVLAEQSWQVYDPEALLDAIRQRENLHSTAMDRGVAFPHPRRALPSTVLGESVIAYGRTPRGVPFGSGSGLADVFFLVACTDQPTHMQVLARLSRMMLRPGLLEKLRAAEDVAETYQLLAEAEKAALEEVLP